MDTSGTASLSKQTGVSAYRRARVLGVEMDAIPLEDLIGYVCRAGTSGEKRIVSYVNVHALNLAFAQPWFRDFLNRSDVVFCDGFGVKWAAKFLSGIRLHRHTPPDWMPLLAKEFARQGLTMYFLGARPGVAQKAAAALESCAPGLRVLGARHGYFDKTPGSREQAEIIAEINALRPNLLVVGFGMPAQEMWIQDHFDEIDANAFLPVGAMFDYLAGEVYRAPRWMTDRGLEWLARLVIEPRRLWKRYLVGNPLFLWRVLLQKFGLLRLPGED